METKTHSEADTFEVPCRVCAEPVVFDTPKTGDWKMDRTLIGAASKGAVHDGCKANMEMRANVEHAAALLYKRAESWKMLCDPLYRNSEAWLAEARRPVNNVAIAKAKAWQYGPKGLILFGKRSGTGKTTAAWVALKSHHEAGRFIVALTHTEFSRQATMLARENTPEALKWRNAVEKCDILFVDDLGKSRFKTADNSGKAGEELLFEILDSRITNLLPCIFTTNTDSEGLKLVMSEERAEPFTRRLREFCESINFDKGVV